LLSKYWICVWNNSKKKNIKYESLVRKHRSEVEIIALRSFRHVPVASRRRSFITVRLQAHQRRGGGETDEFDHVKLVLRLKYSNSAAPSPQRTVGEEEEEEEEEEEKALIFSSA
jgi:hypothetical protein